MITVVPEEIRDTRKALLPQAPGSSGPRGAAANGAAQRFEDLSGGWPSKAGNIVAAAWSEWATPRPRSAPWVAVLRSASPAVPRETRSDQTSCLRLFREPTLRHEQSRCLATQPRRTGAL